MNIRHRTQVGMTLLLVLALAACKDDTIRKAARAADDMATVVSLAIDTKRQLGQTGSKLISNDEELVLTLSLKKVNESVKAFHQQVKLTSTMGPTEKNHLLLLFKNVTQSVADLNQTGVLGIKNESAKTQFATVLAGFTAAFVAIQAALGGTS